MSERGLGFRHTSVGPGYYSFTLCLPRPHDPAGSVKFHPRDYPVPTPPETDGPRATRSRGRLVLLAIIVIAAGATVALDQYATAERDRPADQPFDPKMLPDTAFAQRG